MAIYALSLILSSRLGAQECATCHPAETRAHEQTRMAHAMLPVLGSPFGQNLPSQPLRESAEGFLISYSPALTGGVQVTAERGAEKAAGVIEWVMGSGAQGETPLVRAGAQTFESRVSYFPDLHRFGVTIGQDAGASPSATAALGAHQSAQAVRACVGCHATAVTEGGEPVTPGVQCARCHPGAAEHASGKGKPPFNPGKLTAAGQAHFCGACHRDKPAVDDTQAENVRFQPYRLLQSRCFTSGKLTCTTCHVAHQDARRNDAAFYNQKCQACHAAGATAGRVAHADARQSGDCIGCHMPYVELHPALRFTDHNIRAVKAGDYPPGLVRQRAGAGGS